MSLLVVLAIAAIVVGVVFLVRGPLRHASDVVPCLGCESQALVVQSSANSWGSLAVVHYGAALQGHLRCVIPARDANPNGRFYPVTCHGVTRAGVLVELDGTHAGIEGNDYEYLSGQWTLAVGFVSHQLSCLPSNWHHSHNCEQTPG